MSKTKKNKFKTTSVYVTVSLSLILFLLLVFGTALIQSNKLFNKYKEKIEIDLFFRDGASLNDIKKVEKDLSIISFVNTVEFVPKEVAWETIKEEVGGDFAKDIAEGNPLYNSLNLTLKTSHANLDSIKHFEQEILTQYEKSIQEIYYNKAQFKTINKNFYRWMLYFLILCGLLVAIAVILINNTIRLSIFSKRFLVRTMQLVGAKNRFIRRPFLINAIFQGFTSSIIAIIIFISISFAFGNYDPLFKEITFNPKNIEVNLILFAFITILGILISFVSTSFSLRKYLRLSLDKLYLF
jgi:cell division transport system permease protein